MRPRTFTTTGVAGHSPANNTLRPFANNLVRESNEEERPSSGGGLRRFEALEDLLATRPARDDLVERNILKAEATSALAATQEKLKRQLIEDSLKTHIAARPAADDLVQHNILKGSSADGHVQAVQEEIKLAQVKSNLNRKLSERKTEKELLECGILSKPLAAF